MPAFSGHAPRGALLGAALGLLAAVLAHAPEPDLAVLSCAAAGAITARLLSGHGTALDPTVSTLLAAAVLRFGILEIGRYPLLGALAVAVGSLLLGAHAFVLLRRWRVRRITSGRE